MTDLKLAILSVACAAGMAVAQPAPYAGQQSRPIKSLSGQEVQDLRTGQGMGFAKAAELNGYPGPAHVLEHAKALALSPSQQHASDALMQQHKAQAKQMGSRLIDAERSLDQAFASGRIDERQLAALTSEVGRLQAALREEHLRTHLRQTALLEPSQIQRYAQLRGYDTRPASAGSATPAPARRPHRH